MLEARKSLKRGILKGAINFEGRKNPKSEEFVSKFTKR